MDIKLFKVGGDKYAFSIQDKGCLTSIFLAKHIIPIKPLYSYAWEAYRHAVKLATDWNFHLRTFGQSAMEVATEETLVDHYETTYKNTVEEVRGAMGNRDDEEKAYNIVKIIVAELKAVIDKWPEESRGDTIEYLTLKELLHKFKVLKQKYFPSRVEAEEQRLAQRLARKKSIEPSVFARFQQDIDDQALKEEILEDYAEKICLALQLYHKDIIFKINKEDGEIIICKANGFEENDPVILRVRVNDDFLVDSIVPYCDIYRIYPLHSVEFYQKYWKPIVEELGHFYIQDADVLIVPNKTPLPDIPKEYPLKVKLEGWNTKERKLQEVALSFKKGSDSSLWIFEAVKMEKTASTEIKEVSRYTEQDYLNGIFKCIDPQLKSIYGQTGAVIQVIPHTDFLEVDIDFGRGIGVVRLTEDKIEKVL